MRTIVCTSVFPKQCVRNITERAFCLCLRIGIPYLLEFWIVLQVLPCATPQRAPRTSTHEHTEVNCTALQRAMQNTQILFAKEIRASGNVNSQYCCRHQDHWNAHCHYLQQRSKKPDCRLKLRSEVSPALIYVVRFVNDNHCQQTFSR